jgi:hypothetical protein
MVLAQEEQRGVFSTHFCARLRNSPYGEPGSKKKFPTGRYFREVIREW